jgi:Flp pilus assembly protein TadG
MLKSRKRVLLDNRPERGQSLIEMALILPALILILMGILDLGRAYYSMVVLNDAAAEGAAYAAIYPAREQQIKERAADSSRALVQLTPDMVTVEYEQIPVSSGDMITVTVEFEYMLMTPVINAIVPGGSLSMKATDTRAIY